MPKKIKLTIEYDGTSFVGFQRQKRGRSVQGEMEAALKKLFQRQVKVTGAGRTDSGVHALGQVVHFVANRRMELGKMLQGVNHYLPSDVSVVRIEEASDKFHAQYSARSKIYEYRVLNAMTRSPIERKWSYQVRQRLDMSDMKRGARLFVGEHDFRAFEASGSRRKGAVRRIRRFTVEKGGRMVVFRAESNGFLYKMVRRMVGTLLEIGRRRMTVSELKRLIESNGHMGVGPTVPAQGLFLKQVIY